MTPMGDFLLYSIQYVKTQNLSIFDFIFGSMFVFTLADASLQCNPRSHPLKNLSMILYESTRLRLDEAGIERGARSMYKCQRRRSRMFGTTRNFWRSREIIGFFRSLTKRNKQALILVVSMLPTNLANHHYIIANIVIVRRGSMKSIIEN